MSSVTPCVYQFAAIQHTSFITVVYRSSCVCIFFKSLPILTEHSVIVSISTKFDQIYPCFTEYHGVALLEVW